MLDAKQQPSPKGRPIKNKIERIDASADDIVAALRTARDKKLNPANC